ncbi:MAG TPA: oligosaccharide flippase family protein, partial [Candidatus Omnitrophota bacterium]|nr:oligosaccharide flippase family protein [Candidatus Omnitrophota bacterium]
MMGNIIKTVAKNASFLVFGNIANKLLAFFTMVFFARYLGDQGFGKFSSAQSLAQLLIVFADLGLGFFVIREVARRREAAGKIIGMASIARLVSLIIIFLSAVLFINLFVHDREARFLSFSFITYFSFVSFYSLFASVFMGFEKMEFNVVLSFLEKAGILAAGIFILTNRGGITSVGFVYIICGLILFIVSFLIMRFGFSVKP